MFAPQPRPGGSGLEHVRRANQRPVLGFADYSPALELVRSLTDYHRFACRRHDGRMVIIDRGGSPTDIIDCGSMVSI